MDGSLDSEPLGPRIDERKLGHVVLDAAHAELERRVQERTAQLQEINGVLRREIEQRKLSEAQLQTVKEELSAELAITTRLHELSARLISTTDLESILNEVLNATISLQNADFGTVQLLDPEKSVLKIVAQKGFQRDFLEHFASVSDTSSACGRALQQRRRVIVEDVLTDKDFEPHRPIAVSAGYRAVQSTPLLNPSGEPIGILSTHFRKPHRPSERELQLSDVYAKHAAQMIERKRADQERQKLALLVENSQDFIGIASLEGNALFVNAAGRSTVGLRNPEQVRTTVILDYVAECERERFTKEILPAVFSRGHWDGEVLIRNFATNMVIPMWHRIFFITEEKGERRLALATIGHDVTDRKRSEAAQAQSAHMSHVITMGELTASITHEVSQPLAAVVTNACAALRWLDQEHPNVEKARESVDRIVKESNRAAEVMERIRAVFKKSDPQKTPIQLNDLIQETLALIETDLSGNQIRVTINPGLDLPLVLADRIQLQQVILNLVMNGIESMSAVKERKRELDIVSCQTEDHWVLVSVSDNGLGVSPELFDRFFEPFFTTKIRGTGMGLSISQSIIEMHGGRMSARANADHGATFAFALPLAAWAATS